MMLNAFSVFDWGQGRGLNEDIDKQKKVER